MDDPQHHNSHAKIPRYAKLFVLLSVACITGGLLQIKAQTTKSFTRVEQMEVDINRLRKNNNSANLDVTGIAKGQFEVGDDLSSAEQEFKSAGYTLHKKADGKQASVIAEKRVCPFLTPLTGFCHRIQVGLTGNSGRIEKIEAYYFLQSL